MGSSLQKESKSRRVGISIHTAASGVGLGTVLSEHSNPKRSHTGRLRAGSILEAATLQMGTGSVGTGAGTPGRVLGMA